ncbi:hypothetical protein H6P81_009211 [Aristolochia fimbriata]|uniref:RNA methyltransferase n=1 Tax=Aristolochia fimbriata TaxID=158543 RepID=A0AAV7EMY5_ARIFI|nr:hypothetical protein H6P81_009211 [Aristolochia fimbriata]
MMEVSVYTKGAAPSPGRKIKYAGESVRALPVRIVTVGKKRSKGVQMLFEEYKEKLKYYCCINDVQIKSNPKNTGDVRTQIESEDTIVMQNISPQDWVVVLDERGLDIASEGMAQLVGDAGKTGSSTLVFCIGGPYGHGPKLRERADVSISFIEHGQFSRDRNITISSFLLRHPHRQQAICTDSGRVLTVR